MNIPYRREESAGYLVNWAARLLVRAIEKRLAGGNAGPMPVFIALAGGARMSQTELARWAAVEQPTMANTLSRMERDGLISRTPDPADRRSALVALTPLGHARAAEALDSAREVNAFALGALKPDERPLFLDMLNRVIARLGAGD
jgi:DNA-binding MarR family transcriptional regulator